MQILIKNSFQISNVAFDIEGRVIVLNSGNLTIINVYPKAGTDAEREDKEKDVFVHASAVRDAGLRFLNEGDELQFEIEDGPKGPSAVKLQKKS